MSTRAIVISCAMLATTLVGYGQSLNLRLVVAPQVPAKLAQWGTHKNIIKALVTNSGEPVDARFEAELTRDGSVIAESQYNDMPTVKIPGGVSTFTADQIIPASAMTLGGDADRSMGALVPGVYILSVRLCSGAREMGLCLYSKQQVVVANSYQPPRLLQPENNGVVDVGASTSFVWTAMSPATSAPVLYRFQIFESPSGTSPEIAVSSASPIFESYDTTLTFTLSGENGIPFAHSSSYVWTVTPVAGPNDEPLIEGAGRSEPAVFVVK